jgi:hypothetical protein
MLVFDGIRKRPRRSLRKTECDGATGAETKEIGRGEEKRLTPNVRIFSLRTVRDKVSRLVRLSERHIRG